MAQQYPYTTGRNGAQHQAEFTDELEEVVETEESNTHAVWAVEDAAGSKDRVDRVANDIIEHYRKGEVA